MQQVYRILEHVNGKDIIDILIVSLVFYSIFKIIKGTRAVQILFGLAAIGILFFISHRYQLYSLNWILGHFFDSFLIIAVILFQDQIRSALANFGNTPWLGRKFDISLNTQVEEVVEACGALSREKTGAIVVFEKRNGLLNYINSGTQLDCRIHSDIIYSLFQSISPLHDGALIISGNEIKAAGCFLPLSKEVEIDRHLGTRHRAALGISEVSDAVCVIVSEERGEMKLCYKGIFYKVSDESSLRRQLKRLLTVEETLREGELVES